MPELFMEESVFRAPDRAVTAAHRRGLIPGKTEFVISLKAYPLCGHAEVQEHREEGRNTSLWLFLMIMIDNSEEHFAFNDDLFEATTTGCSVVI
jgi:hypothetical protein